MTTGMNSLHNNSRANLLNPGPGNSELDPVPEINNSYLQLQNQSPDGKISDDWPDTTNVIGSVDSYIDNMRSAPATLLVEKYLKISDFVEYIIDNKDRFIMSKLEHVQSQEDEMSVFMDFLKRFLLNV
mmetsp:Transcript_27175/g.41349  ORF Transcript_27175/g.41349 Transcript_27175/m.41349 type:complete len:128 (-) Transcript_27175:2922-3305(-)